MAPAVLCVLIRYSMPLLQGGFQLIEAVECGLQVLNCSILRTYFVEIDNTNQNVGISRYWKSERTRNGNIADYEKRLVPTLVSLFGKEKAIHETSYR